MSTTSPAATSDPGVPQAVEDKIARRITGLRRNSVAISVMLLFQYGLGMAINLYVHVPVTGTGGAALGRAKSHLPAAVTVHGVFGLFLLVAGVSVLTRAIIVRHRLMIVTSVAGLLAILGAAVSGVYFIGNGLANSSMVMAILTGVALLCYLINVSIPAGSTRT
jgi:hypothetical protein